MEKEELKSYIEIVKTGNPEEVREAKKKIKKGWGDSKRNIFEIFISEMNKFDEIKDDNHKAYFTHIAKWPFFLLGDKHLKIFLEFSLKAIQHPSGKVRQGIINSFSWLTMVFHDSINEDRHLRKGIKKEDSQKQCEENRKIFFEFIDDLYKTASKYHEPRFKKYKYVSSLPAGIYKSMQKLIYEEIFEWAGAEIAYREYFFDKDKRELVKSEETDKKLKNFFEKFGVSLSMEEIKNMVWHYSKSDNPSKDFDEFRKDIEDCFKKEILEENYIEIMDILTEAWNNYPHSRLDGLSPKKMFEKEKFSIGNLKIKQGSKGEDFTSEDINKIVKKFGGENTPKAITITVKYDPVLECITGKSEEKMFLSEFSSFNYLLENILMSYPKIVERYEPNATDIYINSKPVEAGYNIMFEGDVVEFNIRK